MKPFYVYIDEFQKFVTPTIAENFDEAAGFGLHLTLAKLYEHQLRAPAHALEHARAGFAAEPPESSARRIARLERALRRA